MKLRKIFLSNLSELILSALISFLFFISGPFEIYISNLYDFSYDIYDMLELMVPITAIVFVLAFSLFILLRKICAKKIYSFILSVSTFLIIAFYIQGNFLSASLPILDGENVEWSSFKKEKMLSLFLFSLAVFMAIFSVFIFEIKRIRKFVTTIGVIIFSFLIVSDSFLLFTEDATKNKIQIVTSEDNLFDFSNQKNFIILVIDSIEGEKLKETFDNSPEYSDILHDFTFFDNALGAYPFTFHAIPQMLTGKMYLNNGNFYNFLENAYSESPLLNNLEESGYRLGVYEAEMTPASQNSVERFENVYKASGERFLFPIKFIKMQICFSGLKYMPFQLKPLFAITPQNIEYDSEIISNSFSGNAFSSENTAFINNLLSRKVTLSDNPCFRFYHINGAHAPFNLNYDLDVIKDGNYSDGLGCCIKIMELFINKLKESGVYENSVIIIMGDHGYWKRQNPALLIKGFNEKHEFAISSAPISYLDLQDVFANLFNGLSSNNAIMYKENDYRKRIYIDYNLGESELMTEMVQSGKANNVDTLLPTGNCYRK